MTSTVPGGYVIASIKALNDADVALPSSSEKNAGDVVDTATIAVNHFLVLAPEGRYRRSPLVAYPVRGAY